MIGLVNGLVTTLLKVPSFIVTLGMMLALLGGWCCTCTGGAATGNPADEFREIGRGGIQDVPGRRRHPVLAAHPARRSCVAAASG